MSRQLKPCGTVAACMRHYRNGEDPCQPCRNAWNTHQQARRKAKANHPNCRDCGRGMRPANTPAKDYPGLTAYGSRGRCAACKVRAARRTQGVKARTATPTHCVHCARAMRPRGVKIADAPGTVEHTARGQCRSCYRVGQPVTPQNQTRPCAHCRITMRPARGTLEDYPGTRAHNAHGLCTACYNQLRRHGTLEGYTPNAVRNRDTEATRRTLQAYLARRADSHALAA